MKANKNNEVAQEELREEIRKKLSCILEGTSEEKPLLCDIILESNPENCGLSSLEIPSVDKAFLQEGEGIIWFHIDHTPDDEWIEFDDMYTEELLDILNELE